MTPEVAPNRSIREVQEADGPVVMPDCGNSPIEVHSHLLRPEILLPPVRNPAQGTATSAR